MNKLELKNMVLEQVREKEPGADLPPLYNTLLDIACIEALQRQPDADTEELRFAVITAFATSLQIIRGIVDAGTRYADQVTINLMGSSFALGRNWLQEIDELLP